MELKFQISALKLLLALSIALAVVVLGLLLFAYSGAYSVAASKGHMTWISELLEFGMHRSVKTWSLAVSSPPTDLDTPARVRLGAGHFYGGCANCHGAPGAPINAVHDRMLPPPPKLTGAIDDWTPQQLFWLVRHGIKYTGMPFWSGAERDDEVWTVIAFLRQLPEMDEESYQAMVQGNAVPLELPATKLVAEGNASTQLTACDRCHDTADAGPTSALVPRLGGQSAEYLARSLREYLGDRRQSGIMEPVASELDEQQIARLASYYADLRSPRHAHVPAADPAQVERGRILADRGDPGRGIPPCRVCHEAGALGSYPLLAAQPAVYLESQLNLWLRGGRAQTPTGSLMAVIARRLQPAQIGDVSAYYQSLPAPPARGAAPP